MMFSLCENHFYCTGLGFEPTSLHHLLVSRLGTSKAPKTKYIVVRTGFEPVINPNRAMHLRPRLPFRHLTKEFNSILCGYPLHLTVQVLLNLLVFPNCQYGHFVYNSGTSYSFLRCGQCWTRTRPLL